MAPGKTIQVNLKCSAREMALYREAGKLLLKDTEVSLNNAALIRTLSRRAALAILAAKKT
jgi:hypothetical protein